MKVLFVYSTDSSPSPDEFRVSPAFQFGIAQISSLLKANGHETELLVLCSNNEELSSRYVENRLPRFHPDVVAFSAVSTQYPFLLRVATHIRETWPALYLLIGGIHASLSPDEVMRGPFDALCIGEGEYPTLELMDQLQRGAPPRQIGNLWLRQADGAIEKNPPRPLISNLDELPFVDRDIWEPWLYRRRDNEQVVVLGRGCPHDCTYCSNHVLKQLAPGGYVRFRSPEKIVEEIEALIQRYPDMKAVHLEVETIAVRKKWVLALCGRLEELNRRRSEPMAFNANFRITKGSLDEEIFMAFEKAHFASINIGLESGSERVRHEILKRMYSNDDVLRAVELARRHGLEVNFFNLIGLPGETLAEHMETVQLNWRCQPNRSFTSIFHPYPGTALHELCREKGWLTEKASRVGRERKEAVLDLPGFSRRQIQHAYRWFQFRIYKGHRPFWKRLRNTLFLDTEADTFYEYAYARLSPVWRRLKKRLRRQALPPPPP